MIPDIPSLPAEIGQVILADVDCLACHLKICPKDHRCMTQIKPERVAIAGLELIQKGELFQMKIVAEQTIKFTITGMHCVNCALMIERRLKDLQGIKSVRVNFSSATGIVTYDSNVTNKSSITKYVKDIGYVAKERVRLDQASKAYIQMGWLVFSIMASIVIMALMYVPMPEKIHPICLTC